MNVYYPGVSPPLPLISPFSLGGSVVRRRPLSMERKLGMKL